MTSLSISFFLVIVVSHFTISPNLICLFNYISVFFLIQLYYHWYRILPGIKKMLSTSIADSDPSKSIDADVCVEREGGLGVY